MPEPLFEQAIEYALNQLGDALPKNLTYHDYWHTCNGVMTAVSQLCILEHIPQYETNLILVAAAYHDLGFVDTYTGHEVASVGYAQQILPRYRFCPHQIAEIADMILATKLPQSPKTKLEAILADADLDVLGREDFFIRNERLRQELKVYDRIYTKREWLQNQYDFLKNHVYFTVAAQNKGCKGKQQNMMMLEKMIDDLAL
jgi:predicted metal-dependent HD superfamily phosphohydrolase